MIYRFLNTPELITKCLLNNNQAWAEFINRYQGISIQTIRYRCYLWKKPMSLSEAEDISQAFFVKLWQNHSLEKVKDSDNIKAWISMLSNNFAIDMLRKKKRVFSSLDKSLSEQQIDSLAIDNSICITDNIDKALAKDILHEEIDKLTNKEKIAVKMHLSSEMTYRQIATITGVAKSSLATLIKDLKEQVKSRLNKNI